MHKQILLTFDLEEFDLPLEFGVKINNNEQFNVTENGLNCLTSLLNKYDIRATFFTTAAYAERYPSETKALSNSHEIASHSYFHSNFEPGHLKFSKTKLEEITGKVVSGFRMPRFEKTSSGLIRDAGYKYESSINPTFIPGRYNNFFHKAKLYTDSSTNLKVLPLSVVPVIRFPLFWLSFKNINFQMYLALCNLTLSVNNYLHLYFHPWEFADLNKFDIPVYIKKISGNDYTQRFERLIVELKKRGSFVSCSEFTGTASLL
jgi:peptidoglycan/xylan/chitin deacetylase (PgdA/CDA1 family)